MCTPQFGVNTSCKFPKVAILNPFTHNCPNILQRTWLTRSHLCRQTFLDKKASDSVDSSLLVLLTVSVTLDIVAYAPSLRRCSPYRFDGRMR